MTNYYNLKNFENNMESKRGRLKSPQMFIPELIRYLLPKMNDMSGTK